MMAKASRLFCPPDKDAMGRSARSEDTPNMPGSAGYVFCEYLLVIFWRHVQWALVMLCLRECHISFSLC